MVELKSMHTHSTFLYCFWCEPAASLDWLDVALTLSRTQIITDSFFLITSKMLILKKGTWKLVNIQRDTTTQWLPRLFLQTMPSTRMHMILILSNTLDQCVMEPSYLFLLSHLIFSSYLIVHLISHLISDHILSGLMDAKPTVDYGAVLRTYG